MKALVVGGTGPTGPYIVNGLLERGYDVAIFHRGTHEIDEIPPEVEHIHGDPHFLETIEESLDGRTFDIAIATYGRIRFLAQALVGKVGRFICWWRRKLSRVLGTRTFKPGGNAEPRD